MSTAQRIPIPWKHKWRRFRYSVMPVLSFLVSVVLALWLWDQQGRLPNAVGEIEAVRVDVIAGSDGLLAPLPQGSWTLFDQVQKGQVIARLDDRQVRAEAETARLELERLRKELHAAAAQIELDEAVRRSDYVRNMAQILWDLTRLKLDVLDRRVAVEVDRVELKARQARMEFLRSLRQKEIIGELELAEEQMLYDQVVRRLAENQKALAEAETQESAAQQAAGQLSPLPPTADVARLIAPLQAAIDAQEGLVRELELAVEMLELRAPISGTICAIYRWPGQNVRIGDPIITLAAPTSNYVVSYVRQEQRLRIEPGMRVALRVRAPASREVASHVERIGPQVELIPPHLLRDPTRPEWGQPVKIVLPPKLRVRPGELIDITFEPWSVPGGA